MFLGVLEYYINIYSLMWNTSKKRFENTAEEWCGFIGGFCGSLRGHSGHSVL